MWWLRKYKPKNKSNNLKKDRTLSSPKQQHTPKSKSVHDNVEVEFRTDSIKAEQNSLRSRIRIYLWGSWNMWMSSERFLEELSGQNLFSLISCILAIVFVYLLCPNLWPNHWTPAWQKFWSPGNRAEYRLWGGEGALSLFCTLRGRLPF